MDDERKAKAVRDYEITDPPLQGRNPESIFLLERNLRQSTAADRGGTGWNLAIT